MTVAIDVSFPSNLSGFVILIESGIFDCSSGSDCVSVSGGVSFSDCVSDSVGLWGDSSLSLWSVFVSSICLWSWFALAASGVTPRARNSLERGMLTVESKR